MAKATFQRVGQLKDKLNAIPLSIRDQMSDALAGSAADLVALQKRLAPNIDDGGELETSIRWDWAGRNSDSSGLREGRSADIAAKGEMYLAVNVTAGNKRAWYARFFEFGTRPFTNKGRFAGTHNPGIRAQPYFYPAYRAKKKSIKSRLAAAARKGIKAFAK